MRTELYKISKTGGALIRPLIAEFPSDPLVSASDVSSFMFGCCLKIDLQIQQFKTSKISYFPGSNWLSLDGMLPYQTKD